MVRRVIVRSLVAAAVMMFGCSVGLVAAGATQPPVPHIAATPHNLMINSNTKLTGSDFPANRGLRVAECSTKNWPVMTNACVSSNAIRVTTNAHGRFTAMFKAELCGGKHGPFPTSQVCYVGVPHPSGVDTETLVGAAKIIVTYP